jgi:phosphoribosylpyrophosphate synthetase
MLRGQPDRGCWFRFCRLSAFPAKSRWIPKVVCDRSVGAECGSLKDPCVRPVASHSNSIRVPMHCAGPASPSPRRTTGPGRSWSTMRAPAIYHPRVGAAARRSISNVSGAFQVRKKFRAMVDGRSVLLIDDVMTTGATVEACAKSLTKSGAIHVDVLTLARVVRASAEAI